MRTLAAVLLGLGGGVIAGLVISEIIGIVGVLVFGKAVGIKYLPIYLAILFAALAPVVGARFRTEPEQPLYRRNQRSRP
jgi:O-antigen ligase